MFAFVRDTRGSFCALSELCKPTYVVDHCCWHVVGYHVCCFKEAFETLHCIEFFAGVGSIASAFGNHVQARAFDTERSETHNLNKVHGILLAVWSIWSLAIGGLAHFGVVCKSYCWINSGTHRRTVSFPMGKQSLDHVGEGTGLAISTATHKNSTNCIALHH